MWSPQHYIEKGKERGVKPDVLDHAVDQIDRIKNRYPDLPAILTLKDLARRTSVDYLKLRAIAARDHHPYRHFAIRKRSGGHRRISIPEPDLMRVQQWLTAYVLNPLPIHHCSFAFKPGSSIVRCAARHTGASWLVKMDVAGFFSSISEIQVYRVFRSIGYQPLVAFELARLTTYAPSNSPRYQLSQWTTRETDWTIASYRSKGIGYLPQGAPTSPMLSNLVMREIDEKIEVVSNSAGLRYTRYSDDLTFSTRNRAFNRAKAGNLIGKITRILVRSGLYPQHRKTIIIPPGARKVVLGLNVDGAQPHLTREFQNNLRQHLYYLEKFGPVEHAKAREFDTIFGLHNHVRGLIDFANMVDKTYASTMLSRFNAVDWPF